MKTKFRERFEKDIENISNSVVLKDISSVIENVENALKPQEIKNIKKTQG
jgi:hypothetical protein